MIKVFTTFLALALGLTLYAQTRTTVIIGATIHIGNGKIINNGALVFEQGVITSVEEKLGSRPKDALYIDATGKHIYPGLILLNTFIGLNEIDAVRATRDYHETGELNPNVRSLIAYNTDSKLTPTALYNGVTHMQVVPSGGLISGKSCVVKTVANNWEDAAVLQEDGMHLKWPEAQNTPVKTEQADKIFADKKTLNDLFTDAKAYVETSTNINLKYKAIKPVLSGQQNLYIHVYSAKGIKEALDFVSQHQLPKVVLVTSHVSTNYAQTIATAKVGVIINQVHSLPQFNHSDVDAPFKAAYTLMQQGVKVAIGMPGSWESRNVMFNAGTCAGYGLTTEQALQLVTKNAAEIIGVGNSTGTLEPGKQANVIITNGDVLDMRTNQLEQVFIEGIGVDLNNEQTRLYQKYQKR